jgi:hypothetical protein
MTEFRKTPQDKFNHALKALSYGLVGRFGIGTGYSALGTNTQAYRPRFPVR